MRIRVSRHFAIGSGRSGNQAYEAAAWQAFHTDDDADATKHSNINIEIAGQRNDCQSKRLYQGIFGMNSEEFSSALMTQIIDQNMKSYMDMFNNSRAEKSTIAYGIRALTLFHSLRPEQQEVLFEIIRQTSVDTVSSILAVLDGVSPLAGAFEDYTLTYDGGGKLNGDLQSLFLAEEEDSSR